MTASDKLIAERDATLRRMLVLADRLSSELARYEILSRRTDDASTLALHRELARLVDG